METLHEDALSKIAYLEREKAAAGQIDDEGVSMDNGFDRYKVM